MFGGGFPKQEERLNHPPLPVGRWLELGTTLMKTTQCHTHTQCQLGKISLTESSQVP